MLSRLFRRLFLKMLAAAHKAGRLAFFGDHAALADKAAFAAFLAPLRKTEWVVYAKKPFGGPQAVLAYLSRYTHRVAISNRRLISADETGVTFKWKDYRIEGPGRYKTMTLPTHEFIRRFLIHVLPKGLHRIRHYGLFANGNRAANIARARELLAAPAPVGTARDVRSRTSRRVARAAASMSMLRWPHDHHRDLRARLSAKAPPHARSDSDQDRHLMIPSPPIPNRYSARYSCCLSASSAHARGGPLDRLRSRTINIVPLCAFRSFTPTRTPMLRGQEIGSTTSIQFPQALRRGQIPIAPAAPQLPHFPRFRALALFGRRPQERVDRLVNPASENLRRVTFRWKDYRTEGPGRYKTMTLSTHEFIRRFLMHVLPKGVHRIRHYGLFANGNRAANIARARELLAVPPRVPPHETDCTAESEQPRVLPKPCPCCGGRMIIIETFARGCQPRHRPTPAPPTSGSTPHEAVTTNRQLQCPCHSRRLTAGSARARVGPPESSRALTANIVMQRSTDASTPACTVALSPKASRRTLRSNLLKPRPAAKSP